MTIPPYARLAQRLLIKGAVDAPPPSAAARDNAIAALQAAIVQKRRRRHWTRAGIIVAAAAAAATLGLTTVITQHPASSPAATRAAVIAHAAGSGARIVGAGPLEAGGRALTQGARVAALPEGHALLNFATGTVVTLESDSELALVEAAASQTLALTHGALRAQVAKVAPGQHFIVKTTDAQITVHGTSFRVATVAARADCNGGITTRLDVYEGVVSVRAGGVEARVSAGEHWPEDCVTSNVASAIVGPGAGAVTEPLRVAAPAPQPAAAARSGALKVPDSTLPQQNDMFARALAAQRAGDPENAVRELDLLLGRFPNTPLAQAAAATRMKWLDAFDHARAMDAARSYLARYPEGFARSQAETILEPQP